jgi:hypothetical protein
MGNIKKTEIWEVTQGLQKEAGDTPDSKKKFREAEHQAREDAQKAGLLPERKENKHKKVVVASPDKEARENAAKAGLLPQKKEQGKEKGLQK